jgi:hypothetical protein
MASPVNPLDVFVTYIPHYELHLSDHWDELDALSRKDTNSQTTAKQSNGTLLINTRKDAHQHIDNIKYTYFGPLVDPSGCLQCAGTLTMEIIEPNGVSFIEKLSNRMKALNITQYQAGAQFALKIFFVGIKADGSHDTITLNNVIPIMLDKMEAKYSHKGGEYHISFNISSDSVGSTPLRPENGLARAVGFVNKNISFKAGTVQEAMKLLEVQLNKNYTDVYANELANSGGARSLKYSIELDPKITGGLNLVTKDSLAPGEKCQLTFTPSVDIGTMIRQIMMSSKDVCDMIGGGSDGITKDGHPGVKLPILQTFYHAEKSVITVIYRVVLYEGGNIEDVYTFDYYFSGKNVDILEFEVKFNQMECWIQESLVSTEFSRNADGKVPTEHPDAHKSNNLPTNKTCTRLENIPANNKKDINAKSADLAALPLSPRAEGTGLIRHEGSAVPSAKLAFETLGRAVGATNNQVTFTIRGHLDILDKVVYPPNGKGDPPIGVSKSSWIKVNIFDQDENPFFYTGKYLMTTVENIFSGGKFLQNLTVSMVEPSNLPPSTPTVNTGRP